MNSILKHTDKVAYGRVENLGEVTPTAIIRLQLRNIEVSRLTAALNHVSKRKKRKKTSIEILRAEQGTRTLFTRSTEIRRLREDATQRQQGKETKQ